MSTPPSRVRRLRGALIGGCSALVTAAAHAAAGGGLPGGGTLMVLTILSITVGAVASRFTVEDRRGQLGALVAALAVAQAFGHLGLALTAAHAHGSLLPSLPMLALHAAAAVGLAALIAAVEHLYSVCESVLCWLRLILVGRARPAARPRRYRARNIVAQSVLLYCGMGMRAPPRFASLG
ncbi:hypothetical protein MCHIJ_10340 [Mycolicibacterium chitae]|uniref:Integral membrane protein n=1 Tax=Mycolicibacterium chitae TaxID=1792 RepID=A0A3S4RWC8_MYCCI|nr:hypothetical protein [Mycolicibacterium chitae]MCV7107605.1 hypothetical protein [Mycolicibacterium chitae]BBZ01597.1 hypothetical protein MCHIJ_10340 [Mycolicibacterium chitae]VEG50433.1 Uncharacterised protein [Mycolicibacterium chitae]